MSTHRKPATLVWAFAALAASCGATHLGGQDAAAPDGEPEAPEYMGPTSSTIPVYPKGPPGTGEPTADAGPVQVDTTCCMAVFGIDDQEPAGATGTLVGEASFLGDGVALERAGGQWKATVCVPLDASFNYWYRFTWTDPEPGQSTRAGGADAVDAGGAARSFFSGVASCSAADASAD